MMRKGTDKPTSHQQPFAPNAVRQPTGHKLAKAFTIPKLKMNESATVLKIWPNSCPAMRGGHGPLQADHDPHEGIHQHQQGKLAPVGPQAQNDALFVHNVA